jgi:CSLREA domain-containing protein
MGGWDGASPGSEGSDWIGKILQPREATMGRLQPSGSVPPALRSFVLPLLLSVLSPAALQAQTTFTVNTTNDVDDGTCNAAHCSLREALNAAALEANGATITFNIPGSGPHTIRPTSGLPLLMGNVLLDGTTEPDFAGKPVIELDGTNAGGFTQGLSVAGSGNTIRGLVVNRFSDNGISIGSGAQDNVVEGCYVGTDVTGSVDLGNGNAGIMIGQASNNTIGGTAAGSRNLISGNAEGITVVDVTATGNVILGNYIGTDATGTAPIPNGVGVLLLAPGNTVGGTEDGAGNLISGNELRGVDMGPPNATGNVILGNFIGVDVTGTLALGNDIGVFVNEVPDNVIGGTSPGARNVISGNREGVDIWLDAATGNRVLGNYIGTNAAGDGAVPNEMGIYVWAPGNTIGGTEAGAGNVISGNAGPGVDLAPPNATGTLIAGNFIGVDASGTSALGNDIGVWVDNAADNIIGGTTSGAGNVISGNREGITFWETGATGNLVQGNFIGTNAAGDEAIPNGMGIPIYSPGNTIGGTEAGAGNLISGNQTNGVNLYGEHATGNTIQGNLIGTDATGTVALGNGESGVAVVFAAGNIIGGTTTGAGNTLSGNVIAGVTLFGSETQGNQIQGNFIGTDPSGTTGLGNGESGVAIQEAASDNTIGGTAEGAGNVLSGNTFGVLIGHPQANGNRIQGNFIGTNAAGDGAIPNSQTGVILWSQNTIIGGSEAGAGNVISGNGFAGIDLGGGSTGTTIQGNQIGTDATGTMALGNDLGIFVNFSADNLIGGTTAGAGNVISGNAGGSVTVNGLDASGNILQGNYIGTDVTGTVALGNVGELSVLDAPGNTIGGTESGAGNIISGNGGGLHIDGLNATGNLVQGNIFGTDVTGTSPLGNGGAGIRFSNGASDNTVGGTESGAGNIVANSGWHGITVVETAGSGNLILSNSIFDNGSLGIDLARGGVTANDEGDSDTGPNNLQNYPVLTSVVSNGSAAIQATLNSTPSSSFTLEFFSNEVCDPSGYGEGQTPLGTASLATDASGSGSVTAAFSGVTGTVVTATATDADGNTSEFSQCGELSTLAVSPSPATQTVSPGQVAAYTIMVTAQGGAFEGTVDLACSGNPTGTTCSFDQDQVTLASGQASTTMTVTTVAPASSVPSSPGGAPSVPLILWLAVVLAPVAVLAEAKKGVARKAAYLAPRRSLPRAVAMAAVGAIILLASVSCGDDGTKPPSGGTPAGSYELTVTATWESVQASTTVTMVVQ